MITRLSAGRPWLEAHLRTILIATSLASAPELHRNTRSAKRLALTSSSAVQRRRAVEHVAGVPELAGLLDQRGHQVRIVVAEATHGDAGGQIDELTALAVPHTGALAALQYHLAGLVDRQVVV